MLYIIRHGQTEMNARHVLQSRSDHPLNETGIRQAREAAQRLKGVVFRRVYSSPLQRAVQTARLLAPGLPVTVDERLIEMDYGPYEGMDLRSPPPEIMAFFRDFAHTPAPEGMEQLSHVVARAGSFLADVEKEGDILISTHAIAMKGFLEFLTPESRGSYWSKNIANCAVYVTEYRDGAFTVPAELA
ncbi:MAG: histidine phosphatase family protein [Oscillospiraceae bacterium]|nr:histidine phosphatase family protein [Oscillospiraceae bacterium]